MPLRRPWRPLEREVLRDVPDRYGVYELAAEDGEILRVDHGPLRDAIKEALAYDDEATKIRFEISAHKRAAARTAAEHRNRLQSK